jgi:hypothetical protein
VPAVNPDVTILHAQRADRRGYVAIDGIVGAAREAALAAGKLLVTVETVVDELPPAMNNVVLPHFTVTAGSHCPGGAWPSYAQGHYARDNDFYLKWDAIARDRARFTDCIARHVRGTADHRAFLASLQGHAALRAVAQQARLAGREPLARAAGTYALAPRPRPATPRPMGRGTARTSRRGTPERASVRSSERAEAVPPAKCAP